MSIQKTNIYILQIDYVQVLQEINYSLNKANGNFKHTQSSVGGIPPLIKGIHPTEIHDERNIARVCPF